MLMQVFIHCGMCTSEYFRVQSTSSSAVQPEEHSVCSSAGLSARQAVLQQSGTFAAVPHRLIVLQRTAGRGAAPPVRLHSQRGVNTHNTAASVKLQAGEEGRLTRSLSAFVSGDTSGLCSGGTQQTSPRSRRVVPALSAAAPRWRSGGWRIRKRRLFNKRRIWFVCEEEEGKLEATERIEEEWGGRLL